MTWRARSERSGSGDSCETPASGGRHSRSSRKVRPPSAVCPGERLGWEGQPGPVSRPSAHRTTSARPLDLALPPASPGYPCTSLAGKHKLVEMRSFEVKQQLELGAGKGQTAEKGCLREGTMLPWALSAAGILSKDQHFCSLRFPKREGPSPLGLW